MPCMYGADVLCTIAGGPPTINVYLYIVYQGEKLALGFWYLDAQTCYINV